VVAKTNEVLSFLTIVYWPEHSIFIVLKISLTAREMPCRMLCFSPLFCSVTFSQDANGMSNFILHQDLTITFYHPMFLFYFLSSLFHRWLCQGRCIVVRSFQHLYIYINVMRRKHMCKTFHEPENRIWKPEYGVRKEELNGEKTRTTQRSTRSPSDGRFIQLMEQTKAVCIQNRWRGG
jgi:hypothetical protein